MCSREVPNTIRFCVHARYLTVVTASPAPPAKFVLSCTSAQQLRPAFARRPIYPRLLRYAPRRPVFAPRKHEPSPSAIAVSHRLFNARARQSATCRLSCVRTYARERAPISRCIKYLGKRERERYREKVESTSDDIPPFLGRNFS